MSSVHWSRPSVTHVQSHVPPSARAAAAPARTRASGGRPRLPRGAALVGALALGTAVTATAVISRWAVRQGVALELALLGAAATMLLVLLALAWVLPALVGVAGRARRAPRRGARQVRVPARVPGSARVASRPARHVATAAALMSVTALAGCATVRQDQVGVKTTFGRISSGTLSPGAQFVIPGVNSVVRLPARTVNREVRLELPSREGLNIAAEVSILYRIRPEQATQILTTGGRNYEDDVVIPVFRSAAADVAARFMAKDMYGGERAAIEKGIQQHMAAALEARGFVVEQVLLKSIRLPADLAQAVEEKLEAEQRAEQMRFVLDRERAEAERRRIEAEGIRQAQEIVASSLTPMIISFKSIEAFRELARSPNAKVIVTDGRTPYLIGPEQGGASNAALAAGDPVRGTASGDAGGRPRRDVTRPAPAGRTPRAGTAPTSSLTP